MWVEGVMKFTKMQAAGNDFVVIAAGNESHDWSQMAVTMCDRHYGIGADSLLLVLPSASGDFFMRTFDADGSEAEACGNGIRCLAMYAYQKGINGRRANRAVVETVCGIREVELVRNGGNVVNLRAGMGEPELAAEQIPVQLGPGSPVRKNGILHCSMSVGGVELGLNLVSMGNPHAVHFSETPVQEFPMADIGPLVENLPIFPNRVNFEVVRILERGDFEARVWERGVGETLACGTGACATLVAARLLGYADDDAIIRLPGGELGVSWDGHGEVYLSGPAVTIYEGNWPERQE